MDSGGLLSQSPQLGKLYFDINSAFSALVVKSQGIDPTVSKFINSNSSLIGTGPRREVGMLIMHLSRIK